jgi:hypothetical protein
LTCVLAEVAIDECHLLAEQRIKLNRIGGGFGLNKGGAQTPRINDEWLRRELQVVIFVILFISNFLLPAADYFEIFQTASL